MPEYKIVREGTARVQPIMCYQGCGRPEHGSAACNTIAPVILTVDAEPDEYCSGYRAAIRDAIRRLMGGEEPETVAHILMAVLNPD